MINKPKNVNQFLDNFLDKLVREYIENNYYLLVNKKSKLERLAYDESFKSSMYNHIALYSDHGVMHVRDVAQLIVKTLEIMHGIHIAPRSTFRFNMMKGYGVIVAYFHDIGMKNFSAFGRASHSQFATQEIFTSKMDKCLDIIWNNNCGGLAWRIKQLCEKNFLQGDPKTTLRECIALVSAHSKSEFVIEELNDNCRLRNHIIKLLQYDLFYLYQKSCIAKLKKKLSAARDKDQESNIRSELEELKKLLAIAEENKYASKTKSVLQKLYGGNLDSAFAWLLSEESEVVQFIDDIKDTLRALRCADAFRQRGLSIKTSGEYQILASQQTGNSVFVLTNKNQQIFLLESHTPHAIGEANIKNCEYTLTGDVLFSFYVGLFHSEKATANSAKAVAMIVCDIVGDVIDSLKLPANYCDREKITKSTPLTIFLETLHDNWNYTQLVFDEIKRIKPTLANRVKIQTLFFKTNPMEGQRYLNGELVDWSVSKKKKLIKAIGERGFKVDHVKLNTAFNDVKIIHLSKGECLLEADSQPGFVYIPLSDSLTGTPLGGYESFHIPAFTIVGISSVISGTKRNASIFAKSDMKLLMLHEELYLNQWYATYSESELLDVLKKVYPPKKGSSKTQTG